MGAPLRAGCLPALLLALAVGTRAQPAPAPDPQPGATCWIGEQWFQWLGRDADGRGVWLYPHLDGVPEPFFAPPGGGPWEGLFESRFDPLAGRFARRWNAAEAMNELLEGSSVAPRRRAAARLLELWLGLHPAPAPPCWARGLRPVLQSELTPEDVAWARAARERHRALLGRVPLPGTRVLPAPAALLEARDFQQALVQDGYLDVAVVGGNSWDPATSSRQSWDLVEDLARELVRAGFARAAFREATDPTLCEGTVELLGRRVCVRVQLTGGSLREDRVRRGVANLVEGLAQADLVIYTGHSNKDLGCYWVSEQKTPESCFRLGGAAPDLRERFHLLGRRQHQLLALQSCASLPKYARPIAAAWEAAWGGATVPGLLATSEVAWFDEFVPRYRALLLGLLRGHGPRALEAAVRAATTRRPDASPLLLRGVLQPRRTFLLPPGVRIEAVEELGAERGWLVAGRGSDGRTWLSTEVVPQDRPGEVVQVVPWAGGLLALRRDGRLLRVGPETGGVALEPGLGRELALRFLARLDAEGRERVGLLDAEGRAFLLEGLPLRLEEVRAARRPAGRLVALGRDAAGRTIGLDARGRGWAFRAAARAWEALAQAPALADPAPSLLVSAAPAVLWLGAGEEGRALVPPAGGWEARAEPALEVLGALGAR